MRGQKLFKDVIRAGEAVTEGRGRNDSLLAQRNACLLARYYYYGRYKERCYEDILSLLVKEFFLSSIRISRLVQQNSSKIKELKDKEMSIYELQRTWPQYKW
jgi:hypothetical protein